MSSIAVRLPNWVGDVCMALPALRLLAAQGLEPICVGRRWAGDLLAGTGWRCVPLPKGLRAGAAAVRATGAQRGLLLTNSFSSALQWRLAGLRATGHRGELRGWLLGTRLARPAGLHEVEAFWRLAQACVVGDGVPPPTLDLPIAPAADAAAAAALAAAGVAGPFAVLAPLATGTIAGQPKVWPGFPLLARFFRERGTTIVACPGPGEEPATAAALPGAIVLPGLGLGAFAALLHRAGLAVANDSGPMHLAAAAGTPVLGIFGPGDPARTRPWHPQARQLGGSGVWPAADEVWAALGAMAPTLAG